MQHVQWFALVLTVRGLGVAVAINARWNNVTAA
jgi:hypothetical protein